VSVAKLTVKRLSRAADRILPTPAGITVLIYHRVGGGSTSAVDMEPAAFDEQLAVLAAEHRVLSLADALAEVVDAAATPSPGVVITFDDGTTDFTEFAVPALVRHGLPATLYAATHFIDSGERFPWDAPPTTWAALRDAASTGLINIGSHTHSHWLMDRLERSAIGADLDRSIELIGEHIGVAPLDFAYPKAMPGSPVAEIEVRRRFRSAALASSRVNRHGTPDLHRLWRTPVQSSDTLEYFSAKAAGGMRLEGELRSAIGRLRYRGDSR
jgi:peptidoglycan/xylan/chitin deacetylase (PgdA/CDA1 family)